MLLLKLVVNEMSAELTASFPVSRRLQKLKFTGRSSDLLHFEAPSHSVPDSIRYWISGIVPENYGDHSSGNCCRIYRYCGITAFPFNPFNLE